ncbi:hypothetical protein ON010_g16752 [Phytophthora cinnamomi]|nr:hypothetical protein ON010_g16752 [Phytophthora cinnamomi]
MASTSLVVTKDDAVSNKEIHRGHAVATGLVLVSTLFAAVRTSVNLRQNSGVSKTVRGVKYVEVALEEGGSVSADDGKTPKMDGVKHTVDYNLVTRSAIDRWAKRGVALQNIWLSIPTILLPENLQVNP